MKNRIYTLILLAAGMLFASFDGLAAVYHVKTNGDDMNNGTSWATAFLTLQKALDVAVSGDQIWVAAGTYLPTKESTTYSPRTKTFVMKNGVAIYGGFPNSGDPTFGQRNWAFNATTLSGDIGTPGDDSDNSYHVILNDNNGLDATAVLDGFIITGGNADEFAPLDRGSGMYNYYSSPTVTNCSFSENFSTFFGGGMFNSYSSPAVTNCTFFSNSAKSGGGVYNFYSSTELTNCSFSGNSSFLGGGLYNSYSPSYVSNCILWGNTELEIYNFGDFPVISYSIIKGGYGDGTNIINRDPLFVDAANGNLRLMTCSPAIDAGDNTAIPMGITTDLDGSPRQYNGGTVDMGAYELQAPFTYCCPAGNVVFVNKNASGKNTGQTWADAFTDLQDALDLIASGDCAGVDEIWVASGTYKPTSTTNRSISFSMLPGVKIYGGFAGGETSLNQRNWTTNVTTLSGNIGDPNTDSDNSLHVIFNEDVLNGSEVLDGFTITGGNADGPSTSSFGQGGGMHNFDVSLTVSNCTFIGNKAKEGGGMYNGFGSLTLKNCVFEENEANGGGGICNSSCSPSIENCTFLANTAISTASPYSGGGGMLNISSSATVVNCTFFGNSSTLGGGMVNRFDSPTVTNCILWGNGSEIINENSSTPTVTHSIVQGGYPGTGNLDADPLFISPANQRLQSCSPAIDAGDNTAIPMGATTDLDGNNRIYNSGTVDMGAYEASFAFCDCYTSTSRLYVKKASTSGDGKTWGSALTDLQRALDIADKCGGITEIWVAAGIYLPTKESVGTGDRFKTFVMLPGVKIYGGFAGGETNLNQRNWTANVTTLSGDIGTPGDDSDNSYHVVFNNNNGLDETAVLDGFTVSSGNANGGSTDASSGGGMFNKSSSPTINNCSFNGNSAGRSGGGIFNYSNSCPTVSNCTFSGNSATFNGGGIYNSSSSSPKVSNCTFSGNSADSGGGIYNSSNSSPTVSNCTFSGNSAGNDGGGIFSYSNSHPTVSNCTFSDNSADDGGGMNNDGSSSPTVSNCIFSGNSARSDGGGMFNDGSSSPSVSNCTFSDNSASNYGGGMYNYLNSHPTVSNCTFSGNSATYSGGGMFNSSNASPTVSNCIFWENGTEITSIVFAAPTVTHSIVQGGHTGLGNLDADPLFVDAANGDFRLLNCSPAIDAGDNAAIPMGVTTDLDGNARIYNSGTVDMGAYESSLSFCDCYASTTRLYVKLGSTGNGKTWGAAFAGLQDALDVAEACPGITEIWVAAGTYLPTKESGGTGDRFKTFVMLPGVKIYGGFAGGETNLSQRNWTANMTTLSGDIGTPNDDSDNSYHVIFNNNNGLDATAVLDGFAISGGNTEGGGYFERFGAGMYNKSSSPTVTNCTFSGNLAGLGGGGMYNKSSSPDVTDCTFSGNSGGPGGGMYNISSSSPDLTNCTFIGNSASSGGGLNNSFSSSPDLTNCTFIGNSASNGGGMLNHSSSPDLTNCTFSGNSAYGGAMYNYDSSPTVTNCIIWDNGLEIVNSSSTPTVTHSIVQGGYPGTGNLNADPLFVNSPTGGAAGADLRLLQCSPAIDAGSNAAIPMGITTDLDGNARILNATGIPTATVDMGAYEYTGSRTITAVCASPTVQLDAGGNGSLTEAEVDMGSSVDCSPLDLAIDVTTFTCADVGPNTVELTVTVPGLVGGGKCTATVTVEDNVLPTANCQPHTVQLDATGNASISADDVDNGSSDACGISSLSVSPNTFDCVNVYTTNTVTLTVTDSNGNVSTCTAVVTVEDNENPQPTCKTGTVQLDASGQYSLTENDVFAGGTDNCTVVNYWKITPSTVSCAAAGTTVPVLVEVFDASGNQASCTANIFVEDDEMPVAICPANIPDVVLGQNGLGTLQANIGDGSSTDNCSATETSPAINFQCNAGPHSVTLTVTDGFNTVTTNCSFNVVDNQAPVAHCPANIPNVQLDENGNGSLPANIGDGSSTDNCTVLETSPALDFTCSDVGVQTLVLTASDGTNSSTINCSFNVVDNISPSANCVSQTIQVSLNASAQYTLDPNQLDNNSTDACGIQSLSASPAILGCQHEGATTVTLTVTDQNGNTASCTATVEVAEFLTINNVSATAESCAGMGDGSISILATAGGGQLKYSIDGGASFQTSNTFGNLVPGVYNLVVKVFGVPSVCEKTATATVAVGGSLTTWYKDMDGDGYSDGTTQTSCAQPAGYINNPLPGTDCNDSDPLAFPGQVWYEDLDGDGYGSGVWSTACLRPTGCFVASELVVVDTDCDDLNAAVNPVATEICDGFDNDCNGEIDEGLAGTYIGNVLFTTQAQLDAWLACYDVIQGSVTIQGGNITDLSPLSNITEITGNLMIFTNAVLTSLNGLENLSTVGGALFMYYNFQLSDCCAIEGLLSNGGVAGSITIFFNKVGCNSSNEILNGCSPSGNLVALPNGGGVQLAEQAQKERMTIFPNPASGSISVRTKGMEGKPAVLTIANSTGLVVERIEVLSLEGGAVRIDTYRLKDGLYTLTLKAEGAKQVSQRFVKMDSAGVGY